ncbi:MAG TPA: hypothetical protein VFC93_15090 [Chloroflexota bacterium]|nr:hypothetical protein [Chloroflexota bacterium]
MAIHTPSKEETEAIRQALASGQLTVPDPATGYHRSIYADCPGDGQPCGVYRVVRGSGHAITELTMHCTACGREFTAQPGSLYLR